jgi:glycosyltransferase involved in cell wall biosynthesis
MNSDLALELERRWKQQEEYLGPNKPVHGILPLVSVSVPTYQHEGYIAACLDGILMQQADFPFEIIVGEDESVDGTRAVCVSYADRYPDKIRLFLRSRLLSTWQDGGVTRRLNGIWCRRSSRGKYIAMCEGDDCWTDPHKLQRQVDTLRSNPQATLCCHRVKKGRYIGDPEAITYPDGPRPATAGLDEVLDENWIPTCSMLMTREIAVAPLPNWAKNLPFGDWPLQLMAAQGGQVCFLDSIMGFYRVHGGGAWSGLAQVRKIQDVLSFYAAIKSEVPRDSWIRVARPRVGALRRELVRALVEAGERRNAKREVWRALQEDPVEFGAELYRWAGAFARACGFRRG